MDWFPMPDWFGNSSPVIGFIAKILLNLWIISVIPCAHLSKSLHKFDCTWFYGRGRMEGKEEC